MANIELEWNGSYLGSIEEQYLEVNKTIDENKWLVTITYNGYSFSCVMLKENMLAKAYFSIVDEVKPLFGFHKLGTHRITFPFSMKYKERTKRNTGYILIRSNKTKLGSIMENFNAPQKPLDHWRTRLTNDIVTFLLFRTMMMDLTIDANGILLQEHSNRYTVHCMDHLNHTITKDSKKESKFLFGKDQNTWYNLYYSKEEECMNKLKSRINDMDKLLNDVESIIRRLAPDNDKYHIILKTIQNKLY